MKVLQLCYKSPFPTKDGGALSLYNSALSLLKSNDVELKVLAMEQSKTAESSELIPDWYKEITKFETTAVDNRIKPSDLFRNIFSKKSYFVERFYSDEYAEKITCILSNNTFRIIQLEHVYLCQYIPLIRKHYDGIIILRAQNVEHKLWESYILRNKNILTNFYLKVMTKRLKEFESHSLTMVDGVICLSKEDKYSLQQMNPSSKVVVIPIGIDLSKHRPNISCSITNRNLTVFHLGSMDWFPNQQGVDWFIDKVLPILKEKAPATRVHLAGKNMPHRYYKLDLQSLIVDGEVDDATTYMSSKDIMIVPLLSGGGIRVKILEGLASGKVIISTSIGAQGIVYENGKHLLIADTPQKFACEILRCLSSKTLRQNLHKFGMDLIQEKYELKEVGLQKIKFYNELLNH